MRIPKLHPLQIENASLDVTRVTTRYVGLLLATAEGFDMRLKDLFTFISNKGRYGTNHGLMAYSDI